MSDNTAYTPRKRVLLQVVMWVLLVATVGAASLLISVKKGLWRVDLTDAQTYGSLELRLPRNWQVIHQRRGGVDSLQVVEPTAPRRSLSLRVTHPEASGAMDFLMGSGLMEYMRLQAEDARLVEEITVPDGEGIIVHPRRGQSAFAVLAFTDGRIVTVQIVNRGSSSASDDAILYNVATSIRLGPETAQSPSSPSPQPPPLEEGAAQNSDREI